jgi:hypothetical protein
MSSSVLRQQWFARKEEPVGSGGAFNDSHFYRILWKSIGKNSLQKTTTENKGKLLDNFAADFCFAELQRVLWVDTVTKYGDEASIVS